MAHGSTASGNVETRNRVTVALKLAILPPKLVEQSACDEEQDLRPFNRVATDCTRRPRFIHPNHELTSITIVSSQVSLSVSRPGGRAARAGGE